MIYANLYEQVRALLGERTDILNNVKIWVHHALALTAAQHPKPFYTLTEQVYPYRMPDASGVYAFDVPDTMEAVNSVALIRSTGEVYRLTRGNDQDLLLIPSGEEEVPTKFIRVGSVVQLYPRLISAPSDVVMAQGVRAFADPTNDQERVPCASFLIPSVVAFAVAFGKIYLGEPEVGTTITSLARMLSSREYSVEGQTDMTGSMGLKVMV